MFPIQNTHTKEGINSIEDNRSNNIKSTNQSILNFVRSSKAEITKSEKSPWYFRNLL